MRVIQASAVSANTVSVRFSSVRQAPTSGTTMLRDRETPRVTHKAISGTKMTTTGRPQVIQSTNPSWTPVVSVKTCMKIRLGGVPMVLPMPPTLHAYAIPSSSPIFRRRDSTFSSVARAMGSSMRLVAVLDIHMLRNAAAAMKPNTTPRSPAPPKVLTMPSARRRCAPLFSMAVDSMNPPK